MAESPLGLESAALCRGNINTRNLHRYWALSARIPQLDGKQDEERSALEHIRPSDIFNHTYLTREKACPS